MKSKQDADQSMVCRVNAIPVVGSNAAGELVVLAAVAQVKQKTVTQMWVAGNTGAPMIRVPHSTLASRELGSELSSLAKARE